MRQKEQTRAEFNHYKHMMDKVLGTDEELRNEGKHRGGEMVIIDAEGAAGNTATAMASGKIGQTVDEGDEQGSSDYDDEQYEEDFHGILEEVVR